MFIASMNITSLCNMYICDLHNDYFQKTMINQNLIEQLGN